MLDFAKDMEEVCPDAWFLNYTNPMAMLTGVMLRATSIKTIGLCHSVQVCPQNLYEGLGWEEDKEIQTLIAGINHMAWLLEIKKDGVDLYPKIKEHVKNNGLPQKDAVRFEMMQTFGYYVTESSEHNAEYLPYFIKSKYPELIERYHIPLDEYPRRCINKLTNGIKRVKNC